MLGSCGSSGSAGSPNAQAAFAEMSEAAAKETAETPRLRTAGGRRAFIDGAARESGADGLDGERADVAPRGIKAMAWS